MVPATRTGSEHDGAEFIGKFIAEAKRAAAAIVVKPSELEAERKSIARRLDSWIKMAEAEPGSPTIMQQLRTLEDEKVRIEDAIRDAEGNAKVKEWLGTMKPAEALKLIEGWCMEDGATVEERRAALAALVERIEFNPASGRGQVFYRIGLDGAGFDIGTAAARELTVNYSAGAPNRGMMASPRGSARFAARS